MNFIPDVVDEEKLKAATRKMALEVIKLVEALPRSRTADVIGRQLVRSGTSVASNYRAACRGRSDAEMLAKLGIVEEEADECDLWLDLLTDSGICKSETATLLQREYSRIAAICVASRRTLNKRIQNDGNRTR